MSRYKTHVDGPKGPVHILGDSGSLKLATVELNCPEFLSVEDVVAMIEGSPAPSMEDELHSINAEVHSDDRIIEVEFNAVTWFEQAKDGAIIALWKCDWGGDYAADDVAHWMEDSNPDIARMFAHITSRRGTPNPPGFECHVDASMAESWVKDHRPQLAKRLELK